ncbi:hypothetical protein IAT38_003403 [Cryptococcus sp. DSM 104549]
MAPSRGDTSTTKPSLLTYPTSLVHTLDGHDGPVNVVRYNHGQKYLLSGSSDRTIRLWNPSGGKEIKVYRGQAQEVLSIDIAHDNAKFASCGGDRAVFLWDVASGAVIRRLQGHFGKINAVAFSPDSNVLASAGFDAKVMLWDIRAPTSRDPLQTLKQATSTITSLLLPPSPQIISSSSDGHIRTYDLRFGLLTEDLVGWPVTSMRLSPTAPEESLLVGTGDGTVRVWDRKDGGVLQTFKGGKVQEGTRWGMGWGYGEGLALAGDEEGKLWAWNVVDGKPLNPDPAAIHKKTITAIEMTSNGKEMVTASTDGTIKVWAR